MQFQSSMVSSCLDELKRKTFIIGHKVLLHEFFGWWEPYDYHLHHNTHVKNAKLQPFRVKQQRNFQYCAKQIMRHMFGKMHNCVIAWAVVIFFDS